MADVARTVDAPDAGDAGAVARFREALEAAGYAEDHVAEALGIDPTEPRTFQDVAVYERRLAGHGTLDTLIKIFVLGLEVPVEQAEEALSPLGVDGAQALGVVRREADRVHRAVALTMAMGLCLANDVFVPGSAKQREDHVIGAGPASRTLAALTVRVPCRSALDLGTGSGIQALLAARHADRVVATDTNRRALRFTEFNASLNGIDRVECREGSLYEPVAGERFDLVVANPPFVISPETRFEYRDSDLPGDEVSGLVVRGAAGHLEPGGFGSILCNWIQRAGEPWDATPRGWVEGSGCDAWLLHADSQDPLTYASRWLSGYEGAAYAEALDRWLAYDRELGVEAVCTGAVILRERGGGHPWIRSHHVPASRTQDATEHFLRLFRNEDYLASLAGDEELLAGAFRPAPEQRIEQVMAYRDGGYQVEQILLRLEPGLGFVGTADAYVLRLLSGCDGSRPLIDLVREAASTMEVGVEELAPVAIEMVRQMLSQGFLEAPPGV
jgi:methylase of polypeptide subunit release factors